MYTLSRQTLLPDMTMHLNVLCDQDVTEELCVSGQYSECTGEAPSSAGKPRPPTPAGVSSVASVCAGNRLKYPCIYDTVSLPSVIVS